MAEKKGFTGYKDIPGILAPGIEALGQSLLFGMTRGTRGKPPIFPGPKREAPAEGAQKAIESPSTAVEDAFPTTEDELSLDMEVGGGGGEGSSATFPLLETPEPLVRPGEIPGLFAPLVQEVEAQRAPLGRPVPTPIGPTRTFLATFAATLASQMARNPAIAENINNKIALADQRRQAIQEQNYANELLFSKEKRDKLITMRGQILEKQLSLAISQGDDEAARVATENIERLRNQGRLEVAKEEGAQARSVERMKITAKTAEGGAGEPPKPLTMNDFLKNLNDIAMADTKKLPETSQKLFGRNIVSKERMIEEQYAAAAIGGDPDVKRLGMQRLVQSIKKRLKLPDTLPVNVAARNRIITKLSNELAKYNITLEE